MKRNIWSALLALLLMVCLPMTLVSAEEDEPMMILDQQDGYLYYDIFDGEVYITGIGETEDGAVVIPNTLAGYPVTRFVEFTLQEREDITSIQFGKNMKTVGFRAIYNCPNLTAVGLPVGITEMCDIVGCPEVTVYYAGTEKQWNNIEFSSTYDDGDFKEGDTPFKDLPIEYNWKGALPTIGEAATEEAAEEGDEASGDSDWMLMAGICGGGFALGCLVAALILSPRKKKK